MLILSLSKVVLDFCACNTISNINVLVFLGLCICWCFNIIYVVLQSVIILIAISGSRDAFKTVFSNSTITHSVVLIQNNVGFQVVDSAVIVNKICLVGAFKISRVKFTNINLLRGKLIVHEACTLGRNFLRSHRSNILNEISLGSKKDFERLDGNTKKSILILTDNKI